METGGSALHNLVGTSIGRYKITADIKHDEISGIYAAQDTRLDRQVTLKVMLRSGEYSRSFSEQFLGEARSLAQLSHPNILKVLDFGQDGGYLYMVTEAVPGRTLAEFAGKKMDWESAVQLLLPVAEALEYAHDRDIVHRDLKPDNILLTVDNQPMLSDFSITRLVEEEETREMTGTNVGLGSPFYMSPEQGKGLRLDYRVDIYALGIIFFELVTGRKPFEAENNMEVVIQQVTLPPPHPRTFALDLPETVDEIILTAMAKDPDARYQSMSEFINAVRQAKEKRTTKKERRWHRIPIWQVLTAAALLVLLLTGVGALWYFKKPVSALPVSNATMTVTPMASATVEKVLEITRTPPKAAEPPPTVKPTEIAKTPTAVVDETGFQFSAYPKLQGTALPSLAGPITAENASKMVEIMRLGRPANNAIIWSPDEQSIYMGTESGIYIFPISGSYAQYIIDVHVAINSLAISPDGNLLAAGAKNGTVLLFKARTGERLFELAGHTNMVTALNFSPDGLWLVSASKDSIAKVWNVDDGTEMLILKGHGASINDAEFTPDGQFIVTGSEDYSIRVWNSSSGEQAAKLDLNGLVNDIDVNHDGTMVAAAMIDPRVELWSLETNRRLYTLKDKSLLTTVYGIGFSPNSHFLAAASGEGQVRIFNTHNGELETSLRVAGTDKDPIASTAVRFSLNGNQLLVETADGALTLWDQKRQSQVHRIEYPATHVEQMAVSQDGQTLAVQINNASVDLYSITKGIKQNTIQGKLPEGMPIHPESKKLVVVRKEGLFFVDFNQSSQRLGLFPNDSTVNYTEDGKILIVAGDRRIELWMTETGLRGNPGSLKAEKNCQSAYTDNKDYIASGSRSSAINNRDFADFVCQIPRPLGTTDTATDGLKTLVYALNTGKGELWIKDDSQSPRELAGGGGKALAVAVNSDGSLIAMGGEDGQVRIYDPTGNEVTVLSHHTSAILDLSFTKDRTMLLSLSEDGTVEVWGMVTGN